MKPPEFLYNIIDKFSPMPEADRIQLRRDAQEDYSRIKSEIMDETGKLKEGVTKSSLTLKQKFVYFGEHWMVRTALALLFIGCLRWIQDWINPPAEDDSERFFDNP